MIPTPTVEEIPGSRSSPGSGGWRLIADGCRYALIVISRNARYGRHWLLM